MDHLIDPHRNQQAHERGGCVSLDNEGSSPITFKLFFSEIPTRGERLDQPFTVKNIPTEIQSNPTEITSSVEKRLNRARGFSQRRLLKACAYLKGDINRLKFSQFR